MPSIQIFVSRVRGAIVVIFAFYLRNRNVERNRVKVDVMGFVKRMAKRAAARAGEQAVSRWVTGDPKPRRSLRGAQPHERIDALRPDVPPIGVLLLGIGVGAAGLFVWVIHDIAKSGGLGWIIAAVIAFLAFYTIVFRWWLVARKAAYTDGAFFPTSQLFKGAFKVFGPARVTTIVLTLTVLLSLLTQLAGPSSCIGGMATFSLGLAMVGAVVTAIKLGNWYAKDERERYELLWAHQVSRINDLPGDVDSGLPTKVAHLAETFTVGDLPNLQQYAESLGYTITDYDVVGRVRIAELTPVSPMEMKAYKDAARNLGKPVYDFSFRFEWVDNDEPDRNVFPERIETLTIDRAPIGGLTPEKREAFLLALRDSLPKASNGWKITDKQDDPVKTLRYGKPLSLPELVPMRDLLSEYDPSGWRNLNIGLDQEGKPKGIDLKYGPHALVIGPTGSGKTIILRMIAAQALSRGHEVIVIDPIKAATDFTRLRNRLKQTGTTELDSGALIKRIYDEVVRRKKILVARDEAFWADLPADLRERERIRPLMVIIDEFTSLVLPIVMDKNMEKQLEPEEIERTEMINAAKARIKFYAAKIAREARFVGVHLAIATQRPDAKIIDGEFRSQLNSAVVGVQPGTPPEGTTLRMAFPSAGPEFVEIVKALDNGNPGLALVGAEGGELRGIKIGYADAPDIPAIMDGLNIPLGVPGFPQLIDDEKKETIKATPEAERSFAGDKRETEEDRVSDTEKPSSSIFAKFFDS